MAEIVFRRATREQARLRLALIGPSGSGKTMTSLKIASHLGERVALIDTERGSASKYAELTPFDVLELESFHPQRYIEAIKAAEAAGYEVLIIDSLSHAWVGKDGVLAFVDAFAKRSQSANTFTAWRDATPLHNSLVDAMLGSRCHLIVTMRAKTEYVLEADAKGKMVPRKVGLAPVQRDGLEYEFDVVGDMTLDNELLVTKSRCEALTGQVISKPGAEIAATLRAWLGQGVTPRPAGPANGNAEPPIPEGRTIGARAPEAEAEYDDVPPPAPAPATARIVKREQFLWSDDLQEQAREFRERIDAQLGLTTEEAARRLRVGKVQEYLVATGLDLPAVYELLADAVFDLKEIPAPPTKRAPAGADTAAPAPVS